MLANRYAVILGVTIVDVMSSADVEHSKKKSPSDNAAIEVAASSQLMRAEPAALVEARLHKRSPDPAEAALVQEDAKQVRFKTLAKRAEGRTALSTKKKRSRQTANLTLHNPKVDLGWKPCDWQTPTDNEMLHCKDGHVCNPHEEQWTCCATHNGRLQCPKDFPRMCNQKNCGGNDYCCAEWCEYYDGDLPCTIAHQIYGMDSGWLTFFTRDSSNTELPEWKDLVSGPMTWEIWYARRPQFGANTDKGNTIMSTYADDHNTNTYSTHNRRRNIGVYIQPNTGHLSMATFVGDSAKETPEPDDMFAGANVVIGPAIRDNDWHHIAVVWNLTEGKGWLYLDGEKHWQAVEYQPGDENPGLDGKLVIGGGHLGRTSTCQVSQFRLWKVPLAQEHISRIMECGEPDLPITDLKGFYRLSGDWDNSITNSGFLSLEPEGTEGVFADGNPCEVGPPGFKGKDAFGGAAGPIGEPGMPGPEGKASYVEGPVGEPGPNGTQGPPGQAPPPPAHIYADATMTDYFICVGISLTITIIGAGLMHKRAKGSDNDGEALHGAEGYGGENWEGQY